MECQFCGSYIDEDEIKISLHSSSEYDSEDSDPSELDRLVRQAVCSCGTYTQLDTEDESGRLTI